MVIRGAPASGVAAAMGIALGMGRSRATGTKQFTTEFQKTCDLMAGTRPTAVNLFWAIERMKKTFAAAAHDGQSVDEVAGAAGTIGYEILTSLRTRYARVYRTEGGRGGTDGSPAPGQRRP